MNTKYYCLDCNSEVQYLKQNSFLEKAEGKSYYCKECDMLLSEKRIRSRTELSSILEQDQKQKGGEQK